MFADLNANLSGFLHDPGKAYPRVLAIALLAVLVLIVLHVALALLGGRAARRRKRFNLWEKLIYLATLASVGVLGSTAFYTVLRFGGMHGWWLFAHMIGAGALVAVLPILSITWFRANRFGRVQGEEEETYAPRFFWIPKVMFWMFLLSGLAVIVTMLLSMLPLFGTDGLHVLLDIHRYFGMLAVTVLILHFYSVLLQRAQLR